MKKTLLISCIATLLSAGYQSAFAHTNTDQSAKQDNRQDGQSTAEKSGVSEVDSTQVSLQVITDSNSPEQQNTIAPAEIVPQKQVEPEPPAEDQSNTPVSSFNFFYYLIEKIKFPDLLDESF